MALTPGLRLAHYEILLPLGAGGMGEVYSARDTRLGRRVAIKVLPEAVGSNPERLALFEREARTVAALNHPNIVVLHSIEEDSGTRFLTMELVEGRTLDEVMVPGGLPLARVLELAVPMTEALTASHEQSVVHRDLKPRNVMVSGDGRVKVLDFGLAKPPSDAPERPAGAGPANTTQSAAGQVVGTLPYMAPEQIRGETVDARTDLFALGIILYELATGRQPFTGETITDVISAILRSTPVPILDLREDLPSGLDRIVRKCLEKDPRARFQTAEELGQALRLMGQAPESEGEVIRSLVVLPLENVSRDPGQDYFADGMTEALISDLSRLEDLRVISRRSAMKYKGVQKSAPEISAELDVDAIVEGSALLVGGRVRISVQLVSARRDQTLWSSHYDRDLEDVLELQSNVAEAVALEIALRVTPRAAGPFGRRRTVKPEAHLEYLKGMHDAEATSPQAIDLSQRHFRRALELDSGCAPAWAGLAECHTTRADRGMAPPAEAIAQARAAVARALALDDSLAEAHAVLGMIQIRERDIQGAITSLRNAIELNPGLSSPRCALGRVYYCIERHAEAQSVMMKALCLDPLSMIVHESVGDAFYYAREFETSVEYYRKAIALDPRFDGAHTDLARSLEALGRFDEARAEYEEGRRLGGAVAGPSLGLAHLEIGMGEPAKARRILEELIAARPQRVVSAWGIAVVHASLGDADEAFRWLGTAEEEGSTGLVFLRVHPRLDPIRKDPRYLQLVRRLGLEGVDGFTQDGVGPRMASKTRPLR